jgi:hypothetical protein
MYVCATTLQQAMQFHNHLPVMLAAYGRSALLMHLQQKKLSHFIYACMAWQVPLLTHPPVLGAAAAASLSAAPMQTQTNGLWII